MHLVYLAALIAVCSTDKLDRKYLPPASAKTAGGSAGDIQAPILRDSFDEQSEFPKGAHDNEFEGVVVEAVAPGTRASGPGETGLGGPRTSYGSTHSKVGGAAFRANQQGAQASIGQNIGVRDDQVESQTLVSFQQQGPRAEFDRETVRPQAISDRVANIVRYENNIGLKSYSYAYETDNGIAAEESGVLADGVQAAGAYSYTGDDGKLYKVTYTAGEGGYRPMGDHLPTPPPIPDEILRSLEQNAREAAAGLVDNGSYDAAKYNKEGDYTKNVNDGNNNNNRQPISVNGPPSDADISGTFSNQNIQAFDSLNVRKMFSTPPDNTPKDTPVINSLHKHFPNNNHLRPTATSKLVIPNSFRDDRLQTNPKVESGNNFQLSIADKKENSNRVESSSDDDSSRPIYFGSTQLNRETNGPSYSAPSISNVEIRPTVPLNLGSAQSETKTELDSSAPKLQSRPETISAIQYNKYNQYPSNIGPIKESSQFVNDFANVDFNRDSNVQSVIQNNFNSFNNIHSTMLPSAELTTPFEDTPQSNGQQYSSQNVPLSPTQATFSTFTIPESQSYNGAQSLLGATQQGFQQLADNDRIESIATSQGSDLSYYYNQPSKPFNVIKATAPTFLSGNNHFTSISTKYPRPPTVAPVLINTFTDSMQNQYFDASKVSSFGSQGDKLRPTVYPQPPVISQFAPLPTITTSQIADKFPTQYTGITQASASPFPSTSIAFTGASSKVQQPGISNSDAFQQPSFLEQSFNRDQIVDEQRHQLNNMGAQSMSNQQYDGEIYEYKKPEESLPTTTESDETDATKSQSNDFAQFGQKLQPSMYNQPSPVNNLNDSNSQREVTQSIQSMQFQFGSPNSQSFSQTKITQEGQTNNNYNALKQESNENAQQLQMGSVENSQTFVREPATQNSNFPSGAFRESQPTVDYKNPFEFSTRIRPCCQGTYTSTKGKDMHRDFPRPLQRTAQDQREFYSSQSEYHGRQQQSTSQFQTALGEKFSGPRRPPSFDKTSGYNY